MKLKSTAVIFSLIISAAVFSGCGDKSENTDISSSENSSSQVSEVSEENSQENTDISPEISTDNSQKSDEPAKPVLSLSNTEAGAGEIAEITLSVSGADEKWSMCGLHITYPEELECQMKDVEERTIDYKLGDASENSMGSVGMLWSEGLPDELTEKHLGCFFFTEMFSENQGYDGEIAKFYLKIPDDAQSGTVYPLSYYFPEGDLFTDSSQNMQMQEYAFANAVDGSVTVK